MASKQCLICGTPITLSLHRGLEVCRSCVEFFKRVEISSRSYPCRQGHKKCQTRKGFIMCRGCRYAKCVQLGMAVQGRMKMQIPKEVAGEVRPFSYLSVIKEKQRSGDAILDRMEKQYRESVKRRIAKETEYAEKHHLMQFTHSSKKFYIANFTASCDLLRMSMEDFAILIHNVFSDLRSFSIDHRAMIFKNFALNFSMTEYAYYTSKNFKNTSMFASSLISCANKNLWVPEDEILSRNATLRTTVKELTTGYKHIFRPIGKMDKLTDREFYALAILNYCDIDMLNLPDDIVQSTQNLRAKVLEELQEYYICDLKQPNFADRIGRLMMMVHGTAEAGILLNEEIRMYAAMFDMHSDDEFFRMIFEE